MAFLGKKLGVAIPDTVLEEKDSLREKTVKLGIIARACAIYGVDSIVVFHDPKGKGESKLIKTVLEYIETPQYLRKRLFGYSRELRYAGLLPPLQIPSHKQKVPLEKISIGEVREGVTNKNGTVDVGLDKVVKIDERVLPNKRVTVRITNLNPPMGMLIGSEEVHEYWGYTVEVMSIDEMLSADYDVKIATSRYGNALKNLLIELSKSIVNSNSILFIFGSPSRGLFDIIGPSLTERVNYVINLFAEQHVQTVRTEEAIFTALSLANILSIAQ